MNTVDAIMGRRAVKVYDPNHVMPAQDEEKLLELARNSPTSFNMQNWRFVVVKDKKMREELKAAAWGQAQVAEASLLVILCADIKAWAKQPERYLATAPKEVQDYMLPMVKNFYDGREWQQRDEAMRSIGIAAQTLMIAAKDMGYESCPMIGFDPDAVGKIINLPSDHVIGMMLAIGKGMQPARPKSYLPVSEVVIQNRFG